MPLKQAEAQLFAVAQRAQNASLTALTWKRDRWVEVEFLDGLIYLREEGYEHQELTFSEARALKHALKQACAREFPRSNRVHVIQRP